MEHTAGNIKSGFKYHVEHVRSVSAMQSMGLSIEGLERRMENGIDSVVLSVEDVTNLIPTEGLNYLLGAGLTGVTQIAAWFIALFEGNYVPTATITAATFTATATESVAYNEAARVAWVPGAIAAGSVSNTLSKAVFTMNATKSIYGIGQLSASAKTATTGTIVSCAAFAAVKNVVATDVLSVTSTLTATSA